MTLLVWKKADVDWGPAGTCRVFSSIADTELIQDLPATALKVFWEHYLWVSAMGGGPQLTENKIIGSAESLDHTKYFAARQPDVQPSVREVITRVAMALEEKGYRPVDQLVGFLVTGDPAYVTSHGDARLWVRKLERDKILEEMLREYLAGS